MPKTDDATTWHKIFAASAFNQAWDLIDQTERSGEDDGVMLMATFASRHHWEAVGTDENRVVGDWQIAHVAAVLGFAPLALMFARAALDRAVEQGFAGWRLASCHEGMARAHACSGDEGERDRHIRAARNILDTVEDLEERGLVESQLESVPGYRAAIQLDD
jgi:hypothetical protein